MVTADTAVGPPTVCGKSIHAVDLIDARLLEEFYALCHTTATPGVAFGRQAARHRENPCILR